MDDARRREIDVVLVWWLDRWGRSVTDLLVTLQELEHFGVGFVSLTEALDLTTPEGRAMAAMLAVFAVFEREALSPNSSEDCLYLNVWRPATAAANAKMPVMVWIYGGAFLFGSGSNPTTSGVQFAKDGVVLVTFNYRLGRIGFFAFPALSREHPEEFKGNYAYMDQLEALKWVQRNIAEFGGDPKNVTIFGESAGGASVHVLVSSPAAKGLFQKAIIESGGGRDGALTGCPMSRDTADELSAETIGRNFARKHGIEGDGADALAKLRALTPAELLGEGQTAPLNSDTYSGPIVDGRIVVETSQNVYKAGRQMRIPLMVGANSADAGGFVSGATKDAVFSLLYGARKAEAMATYDPNGTIDLRALIWVAGRDRVHLEPARMTARAFAKKGAPVYAFRFSYVQSAMRQRSAEGAAHAAEIPYVFNTLGTEEASGRRRPWRTRTARSPRRFMRTGSTSPRPATRMDRA